MLNEHWSTNGALHVHAWQELWFLASWLSGIRFRCKGCGIGVPLREGVPSVPTLFTVREWR